MKSIQLLLISPHYIYIAIYGNCLLRCGAISKDEIDEALLSHITRAERFA